MAPHRIRQIRLTMNMTQQQFMKVTGLTQSSMSKIESGLLNSDKFDDAINAAFSAWKISRIAALNEEINFIESL